MDIKAYINSLNTPVGLLLALLTLVVLIWDFSGRLMTSSDSLSSSDTTATKASLTKQPLSESAATELKSPFIMVEQKQAPETIEQAAAKTETETPTKSMNPRLVDLGDNSVLLRAVIRDKSLKDSPMLALIEVYNNNDQSMVLERLADKATLLGYEVRIESNTRVRLIKDSKPDIALIMYDDKS
jgi:hypothetical protein